MHIVVNLKLCRPEAINTLSLLATSIQEPILENESSNSSQESKKEKHVVLTTTIVLFCPSGVS